MNKCVFKETPLGKLGQNTTLLDKYLQSDSPNINILIELLQDERRQEKKGADRAQIVVSPDYLH